MSALAEADTIVGYKTYIELVRDQIEGKTIISTAMTKEVQRVEAAIDKALSGHTVALISSGDPGIYAMAGLVFEMLAARHIPAVPYSPLPTSPDKETVAIEIIPGIPALCAGAALLGAPLTHDFAAISLSDLLTPWEVIEKRIEVAAQADFVIVLYNPKSKKRDWQLKKAQEIVMAYRAADTPVGIAKSVMRADQTVTTTSLGQLHQAHVDMQSTVFIGNSTTRHYGRFIYTPRGYGRKYDIE